MWINAQTSGSLSVAARLRCVCLSVCRLMWAQCVSVCLSRHMGAVCVSVAARGCCLSVCLSRQMGAVCVCLTVSCVILRTSHCTHVSTELTTELFLNLLVSYNGAVPASYGTSHACHSSQSFFGCGNAELSDRCHFWVPFLQFVSDPSWWCGGFLVVNRTGQCSRHHPLLHLDGYDGCRGKQLSVMILCSVIIILKPSHINGMTLFLSSPTILFSIAAWQ